MSHIFSPIKGMASRAQKHPDSSTQPLFFLFLFLLVLEKCPFCLLSKLFPCVLDPIKNVLLPVVTGPSVTGPSLARPHIHDCPWLVFHNFRETMLISSPLSTVPKHTWLPLAQTQTMILSLFSPSNLFKEMPFHHLPLPQKSDSIPHLLTLLSEDTAVPVLIAQTTI